MKTPFSIVGAWTDLGDPYRRASRSWTRDYWAYHFPEAELVMASPDPFTRARGLNEGIRFAEHDLIVQADPDSIVPPEQIVAALALAQEQDGLVVPATSYLYLLEEPTRRLHRAPFDELPVFGPDDCHDSGPNGLGNVTAFTRRTWTTVGGYDERFGIWGGDDAAFAYAADAFFGPVRRVAGDVLHSYHPRLPQSIPGGEGYAEQFAILAEWRDASATGKSAVRAMVEAHRCV